jgi:hypothetical protein
LLTKVGLQPAKQSLKRKLHNNELSCHFMVGDSPVTLGPVEFWLGSTGPLVVEESTQSELAEISHSLGMICRNEEA